MSVDEYLSEREQWEQVKAWLRANGAWIIAGIVIAGAGVWGWRWWQEHQNAEAIDASMKYESILDAFDKGDRTRAMTLIGELSREHPNSPYNDQAQLAEAKMYVQGGQLDKAAGNLRGVMERTDDSQLALTARLRLARVQLALNKPDDALATLAGAPEPGEFDGRYREARGDILLAKADRSGALAEYKAAQEKAPRGTVDSELLDLKIKSLSDAQPKAEK
jgi:predicted negative regulator of RcsB-dependent stress response